MGGGCAWRGPVQGLCVLAQGLLAMHHADSGLLRLSPLPPVSCPGRGRCSPRCWASGSPCAESGGPGCCRPSPALPPGRGPRQVSSAGCCGAAASDGAEALHPSTPTPLHPCTRHPRLGLSSGPSQRLPQPARDPTQPPTGAGSEAPLSSPPPFLGDVARAERPGRRRPAPGSAGQPGPCAPRRSSPQVLRRPPGVRRDLRRPPWKSGRPAPGLGGTDFAMGGGGHVRGRAAAL